MGAHTGLGAMADFPKIAFVAGTLGTGGAEQQLFYNVKALIEAGSPPVVLTTRPGETWFERLTNLGVEVALYGEQRSIPLRLRNIIRLARQHGAEVLQAQHFYVNPYVYTAGRITGIPEIGAVRSDLHSELAGPRPRLREFVFRRLRLVACNSMLALERGVGLGVPRERLFFLPNVVDTARFQPREREHGRPITVATAGRLIPLKRFDRLLRVFAAAQREMPSLRLRIAGDGPERPKLEAQAAELGIRDITEFTGRLADTAPLYASADIFLLTSDHEGTPNVIMEAMASGLPIIASATGGTPALLGGGAYGILVPPNDEERLTAEVLRAAGDSGLRAHLGEASRAAALLGFSTAGLPGYLEGLYGVLRR